MGVKVTYKGETLTDFSSSTKILKTSGKYMEDNVTIVDTDPSIVITEEHKLSNGGTQIDIKTLGATPPSVVDTLDENGGTVRTITSDIEVNLQSKEATPSTVEFTVAADSSYQGLSEVIVKVPSDPFIVPTGTITIDTNGTYAIGSYESATVAVIPSGLVLQNKSATPSTAVQTITADTGYDGLSSVEVGAIPSEFIIPTGTLSITQNGTTDVTNYASVSVNVGTVNNQDKTVTPTESQQSVTYDNGYTGLGTVTVNAVPSSYVGSDVARNTLGDIGYNWEDKVSIPSGYFEDDVTYTIPESQYKPNPYIEFEPGTGLIKASVTYDEDHCGYFSTGTQSAQLQLPTVATSTITPTESRQLAVSMGNYVTGPVYVGAISSTYVGSGVQTQAAATITPSESQQTAVASQRYTTGNVVVAAISASYVGSGITQRSSTDLTTSDSAVTVPAGYYSAAATKTVSAGTAGTPMATKGTVSNHQISITPSVTNTTGWITGSTQTGTAATVSASELVSGTSTISTNGTYDVTNYASAAVSIPIVTYYTGSSAPTAGLGSNNDIYLQTS